MVQTRESKGERCEDAEGEFLEEVFAEGEGELIFASAEGRRSILFFDVHMFDYDETEGSRAKNSCKGAT
jgi:hypothetical protein